MHTVRGVFDDRGEAELALVRLVEAGMPRECGHITPEPRWWAELARRARPAAGAPSTLRDRLRDLIGIRVPGAPGTYADVAGRGRTVVVVHGPSPADADLARRLLAGGGAFDVRMDVLAWDRPRLPAGKA